MTKLRIQKVAESILTLQSQSLVSKAKWVKHPVNSRESKEVSNQWGDSTGSFVLKRKLWQQCVR